MALLTITRFSISELSFKNTEQTKFSKNCESLHTAFKVSTFSIIYYNNI